AHRRIGLRRSLCLLRHRIEAETRRQHQPLLRASDGNVDTPGIMLVFERADPGNGVDHQQRGVFDPVQDLADLVRMGDAAGRGLIVDNHHRLDLVLPIGGKVRLDLFKVGAMTPVARQEVDLELELVGDAAPQHRKLTGFRHQHLVAGLERIDDRGLPGAGARRWIDDDRLLGAEYPLSGRKHVMAEPGELRATMIHGRHVHGPQHPVGHVGGSWNLEKMPSSMHGHGRPSRDGLDFTSGRIALFGGLVPRPAGPVNAQEDEPLPCQGEGQDARQARHSRSNRWRRRGPKRPEIRLKMTPLRRGCAARSAVTCCSIRSIAAAMRPMHHSTRSCRREWWSPAPWMRRGGRWRSLATTAKSSPRVAAEPRNVARPSTMASSSMSPNTSTASFRSTLPTAFAQSSRASCSTTSTGSSSRTAFGSRSMSPPPRAPPSAAWPATIPAADARCVTAPCATIRCRWMRHWRMAGCCISARCRTISQI